MTATPIEIIKEKAKACQHPELARPVWLGCELGLYNLTDTAGHRDCFIDVPLRSVVALGRKDFWGTGDTWRQALANIRGDGWPGDIFGYYESELRDKEFPAPGSRRELRLQCIGGACQVGSGNHRLVAGKNWLIARKGGDARLLKAKVSYYRLPAAIKALLARAIRGGFNIQVAGPRLGISKSSHILIRRKWRYEYWAWDGKELTLERGSTRLAMVEWWFGKAIPDFGRDWKRLPRDVAAVLIDDAWVIEQLPSAIRTPPGG